MLMPKSLLSWSLFLLNINGVDPRKNNIFKKCLKFIVVASNCFIVTVTAMEIILNWNGLETIGKVGPFPNSCLCFFKLLCIIYYKDDIKIQIETIKQFWVLNKFGGGIKTSIEKLEAVSFKFWKIFVTLCLITASSLAAKPLIDGRRELSFPGYDICDLKEYPCFEILSGFQAYHTMFQLMPVVMGFDGLFLAFVTCAFVEIEMIKRGFHTIFLVEDATIIHRKLNEFVEHHNLVLGFIKRINKIFSTLLFAMFMTSMGSVTFGLFMITKNGFPPEVEEIIKTGPYILSLLAQMAIYCTAGAILMEQTNSISDVAFYSSWYKMHDPRLQKSLIMLMRRSQKFERIQAGKFYDLNLVSFTALLRQILSIYTLMDTLRTT